MVFSPTMNTVIEKMNGTLISSAEQYIVEVWQQQKKVCTKTSLAKDSTKISPNLR